MAKIKSIWFASVLLLPSLLFAQNLVPFEQNELHGFKNKSGKVVIPAQYILANEFNKQGVTFVLGKEGWKCIDQTNKFLLTPFIYDNGPDYEAEGLARFVENKKIGFFNSACQKKIEATYDFALPFENKFSVVCNGCKLIPIEEHSELQGGSYGVIDQKGKIVVPIEFDSVSIDPKKKSATALKGKTKKEIKLP
ncbi:WG repeat-containing protein [Leptospira idonii]|uniref:WG repeat-containing protein n=1 Tax=Leptospira idonii TaxID=1193500 RepID=A0A4R9LXI2_9LEPT|nr:WG repeat-containing protein [Leptospira idonii]TGN18052.1 WG repeat-containing protein [Leptospira idonii]